MNALSLSKAAAPRLGNGPAPRRPKGRWSPNHSERQRLLLENLPEVRHIARRIQARLPPHVPFDDLVHSGVLGLIDAVDKFDPDRSVSFRSYSQFRIRGAILDSLRQLDWGPRSLRRLARRIEEASNQLTSQLGRVPLEPELAAHLGFPLNEFQHIVNELHNVTIETWSAQREAASFVDSYDEPQDHAAEDPFQICTRSETTRMLMQALDSLKEKERRALILYYFEERTMKEVAKLLHLHESRISQIISSALGRLRVRLQDLLKNRPDQIWQTSKEQHGEITNDLPVRM